MWHLGGKKLKTGRKAITLHYGEAVRQLTLDFGKEMAKHGARSLYTCGSGCASGAKRFRARQFFLPHRAILELPKAKLRVDVQKKEEKKFSLRFSSPVFQHQVGFHLRKNVLPGHG